MTYITREQAQIDKAVNEVLASPDFTTLTSSLANFLEVKTRLTAKVPSEQLSAVEDKILSFSPPESQDLRQICSTLGKLHENLLSSAGAYILSRRVVENKNAPWLEAMIDHHPKSVSNAILSNSSSFPAWRKTLQSDSPEVHLLTKFFIQDVANDPEMKGVPQRKAVVQLDKLTKLNSQPYLQYATPEFLDKLSKTDMSSSAAAIQAQANLKRTYLSQYIRPDQERPVPAKPKI